MTFGESSKADSHATAWLTVGLCLLASAVEGFDIQSAGVAATRMAPQFGLHPQALGYVLAASPLGLLFGAGLGGRLGDRLGRKWVLAGSLVAFGVFSAATALAPSYGALVLIRFLTGLGLGGALPSLIALTAEATRPERRNAVVGLAAAGMPLGGVVPGLLAVAWPAPDAWRLIFWVGGAAPIGLAAVLAVLLPESGRFKASRDAGRPTTTPIARALFGEGRGWTTVLLGAAFFSAFLILYLLQNWLPSLMVARGFTRADAGWIQAAFNVGGAAGAVGLGLLMDRGGRRWVLAAAWGGMALALIGLSAMPRALVEACGMAVLTGVFVTGSQLILYGLASGAYATAYRSTGVGFSVALGRVGSIAGPIAAAALVAGGRSSTQVLTALLPVVALGAVAAVALAFRPAAAQGD